MEPQMGSREATSDDARQMQMMRVHTVHNVAALTRIWPVLQPEWCIPSPTDRPLDRETPRAAAARDGKRHRRLFIYKCALRSITSCPLASGMAAAAFLARWVRGMIYRWTFLRLRIGVIWCVLSECDSSHAMSLVFCVSFLYGIFSALFAHIYFTVVS